MGAGELLRRKLGAVEVATERRHGCTCVGFAEGVQALYDAPRGHSGGVVRLRTRETMDVDEGCRSGRLCYVSPARSVLISNEVSAGGRVHTTDHTRHGSSGHSNDTRGLYSLRTVV